MAPSSYSYNATFCDIMTLPLQCDISYCDIMSKDKVSFDILARNILLQCDNMAGDKVPPHPNLIGQFPIRQYYN